MPQVDVSEHTQTHMQCQYAHRSGPHKLSCCATAIVPWLPNRELESLRHGVIQAACKVEFQPFTRSYSQLTFFNFFSSNMVFVN